MKSVKYLAGTTLILGLLLSACSTQQAVTVPASESSVMTAELEAEEKVEEEVEESSEKERNSLLGGNITLASAGFDKKVRELQEQNSDTIGWISIDGTKNAFPLMQTEDNAFYLLHDFEKNYLDLGLPYLDASNMPDMTDQNSVIYGHMPYGTLEMKFGVLRHYKNQEYVDQAPKTVTITTNTGIYKYRLFSLHTVAADAPYRHANDPEEVYTQFLQDTLAASEVDFHYDKPLTAKDRILTLSTCTTEHNLDYRIAVVGVLEKAVLTKDAFAKAKEFYAEEPAPVEQAAAIR